MDLLTAIKERHSVRSYKDKQITGNIKETLLQFINECNKESKLHIQLICDEPKAFSSILTHYGMFKNVNNYIAVVGKPSDDLYELCGYYGEKIVLKAQQLGLSTCWVAGTYSKRKTQCQLKENEKLVCIITIGYGTHQGKLHKSKQLHEVVSMDKNTPAWFIQGVEAALLAPTALNKQNFTFTLNGNVVEATAKKGMYTSVDLGIAKYHFEIGAKKDNFQWK